MKELTTKQMMKINGWYWCRHADEEEYFPVCIAGGDFWCPDANIHVTHKNGHGGYHFQHSLEAVLRDKEQELRWFPMEMKTNKLRK